MSKKFLTIEQTAAKLGLNYKTIFRYIHSKKLKAVKLGYWRIYKNDLQDFIKQNTNVNSKKL